MRILITGSGGQLGKALRSQYPEATALDRKSLDIADIKQINAIDWSKYDVIINAAAYVNADKSETQESRSITWGANANGPRNLADVAIRNNIHLIHFSSEYVFDGSVDNHNESETMSPLSVYGQTKAAADLIVSLVPNHHILRTTWVVGDGHNLVGTMKRLADMRIDPSVVDDQFGRLTFTSELVRAVDHILKNDIEAGTYNLSNSGAILSWADIAEKVFEAAGYDKSRVKRVSTKTYSRNKNPFAPRPRHSDLDLSKIQATGFRSRDYDILLREYVEQIEVEE